MAELRINTTGKLSLFDADDSHAASIVAGTVTANENVMSLATAGVTFNVPTITLGDATAEDTKLVFDGNAQDFYIGLDDSADDLVIGLGSTVGTTPIISLDENMDIAIGPTSDVTITNDGNTDTLTLKSTDADGNSGPNLKLARDSGSPADGDVIGQIMFTADDDGGNATDFFTMSGNIRDASNGNEEVQMVFYGQRNGAVVNYLEFDDDHVVFNEGSADIDFRVESNGNADMFLVDGGGDCVSIGQSNDMGEMVNITSGTSNNGAIAMGSTIGGTGSAYGGHLKLFLGSQSNAGSGIADTQAGDTLGRISFNGQGTDYSYQGAEIAIIVQTGDGNDNRSNQGTAMVLKTMNVGSTGYAEHFRIAQDGTLTATDTTIGSNSDERLKENIQDYTYDIAKFKQFKPKTFDWKNPLEHDGKSNNRGFIAQEISAIDDYWTDQVDISMKQAEGNPAKDLDLIPAESNGMHLAYTSKLGKKDAMYVSIIQQLITRIEALENK